MITSVLRIKKFQSVGLNATEGDMTFKNLKLEDRADFEAAVDHVTDTVAWEYSFAVIWVWDAYENVRICKDDGMVFLYTTYGDKKIFYPPYCAPERMPDALAKVEAYCAAEGIPFFMRGLSNEALSFVDKARYRIEPEEDSFDYIYSAEDLIALRGKRFHSKRNYVTRFAARYPGYTFRPYTAADSDALLALYDKWNSNSEHETLKMERHAISRAFGFQKELELLIYVLEVEGAAVGFSVSAPGRDGVMHNIFEKGDVDYEGVYQTVNKLTAQACFSGYRLVNRQEDMGIEGLRKAKLSYNPVFLQPKYTLRLI